MPLLLVGILGLAGTYFLTTNANGDSILTPPQSGSPISGIPGWVIPTVVVGVGAILLYKEGAKLLKV